MNTDPTRIGQEGKTRFWKRRPRRIEQFIVQSTTVIDESNKADKQPDALWKSISDERDRIVMENQLAKQRLKDQIEAVDAVRRIAQDRDNQ